MKTFTAFKEKAPLLVELQHPQLLEAEPLSLEPLGLDAWLLSSMACFSKLDNNGTHLQRGVMLIVKKHLPFESTHKA